MFKQNNSLVYLKVLSSQKREGQKLVSIHCVLGELKGSGPFKMPKTGFMHTKMRASIFNVACYQKLSSEAPSHGTDYYCTVYEPSTTNLRPP
jgi:hypothetical protein